MISKWNILEGILATIVSTYLYIFIYIYDEDGGRMCVSQSRCLDSSVILCLLLYLLARLDGHPSQRCSVLCLLNIEYR